MADVTISYKGNTIAEMNESGSKTLKTSGKYCEGDIGIEYVKSGGGGAVEGQTLDDFVSGELQGVVKLKTAAVVRAYGIYLNHSKSKLDSVICYEATKIEAYGIGNNYGDRNNPVLRTIVLCKATQIQSAAFLGDRECDKIIILTDSVCQLDNTNAFANVGINFDGYKVYVPQALLESYKTATNWAALSDNIVSVEENRSVLEPEFNRIGFEYDWGD